MLQYDFVIFHPGCHVTEACECNVTDPSQRPAPLITVAMSDKPCCSHSVKNILQSKEKTDNMPPDETEQVAFGIKQSLRFQIW